MCGSFHELPPAEISDFRCSSLPLAAGHKKSQGLCCVQQVLQTMANQTFVCYQLTHSVVCFHTLLFLHFCFHLSLTLTCSINSMACDVYIRMDVFLGESRQAWATLQSYIPSSPLGKAEPRQPCASSTLHHAANMMPCRDAQS